MLAHADLKRCDSCHGARKMVGLGLIEKDCKACQGIGWIKLSPSTDNEKMVPIIIKKSRGRPKREE